MAEQDIEYESDPEEAKLSLKMRRREASDDEEEGGGGGNGREKPPRRINDSDEDSEGAAAEYEDELEEGGEDYDLDEEYLEDIEEEEEMECEGSGGGRAGDGGKLVAVERMERGGQEEAVKTVSVGLMKEKEEVNNDANGVDNENNNGEHEKDRKEIEPFAVPTAGAFYMHDDRFRENAGGRNRRVFGRTKLWESKDDRKWGHDKFEELTMHERRHEESRRGSRGGRRGRGRNRGAYYGYAQGSRPGEHTSDNSAYYNNNDNNVPRGVRGRGPRRYQPSFKNSNEAFTQKRQPGKSREKHSHVSSGRTSQPVSSAESDVVLPRKQVASNLSIASPPFYPTASSTGDSTVQFKRDVQSAVDESFNMARSTGTVTGKNITDSIGVGKLYISDSPSAMAGKSSNTMQTPASGSFSMNPTQRQLRGRGRGLNSLSQMAYRPAVSSNQVHKVPPPSQPQSIQRNPGQIHAQASVQASVQQFTQRLPSGPQAASMPQAADSANTFESRETESTSESSQVMTALVAKGKGGVQGSGKGSFLYGGSQAMGASGSMSSGHSDQNFPAFLPVMQFGGQHPGGIGVPAVGMAFPGYVAQPQLGPGSSEMTWLPVLAGAAGALGATYCPPYITVDGSYKARPSGQAPSTVATSSQETNAAKVVNDTKSSQKPELAGDNFGQRPKNPRRYTEMKFGQ